MISHNTNKELCCGCTACSHVCPKHCIEMKEDQEGFLYPIIKKELCIDCGLCEKVCPFLNPDTPSMPVHTYGAYNKEKTIRKASSSGGVFYLMAKKVIENGGVVFGARFDDNWEVVIDYVDNISDIYKLIGSKYVQAQTGKSYYNCKIMLDKGRPVLFTGTPCQILGLRHYLRKDYTNLYLLDFICHGVPSPKVWRLYLKELLTSINCKTNHDKKSTVKNKSISLKRFHFSISTFNDENLIKLSMPYYENEYMRLFLNNTTLRPSCYSCKVKGCSSKSDITIGDFWGITAINPSFDDDNGTSVVMIHSQKGCDFFDLDKVNYINISYEDASLQNSSLLKASVPNIMRTSFFENLGNGFLLDTMRRFLNPTKMDLLKQFVKQILRNVRGLNKRIKTTNNYQIKYIRFRDKESGWRSYSFSIILQKDNSNIQ